MATQVASLYAAIGADLSGLNKGLTQAQSKLKAAGASMAKVGAVLSASVTAPVIAIGKKSLSMAGDFEQAMALLKIALGDTGADMQTVQDYALKMGADTVFGAQDMADAMTGLAKAGQTWAQIAGDMSGKTGTLTAATNLAAASDLGLAEAADAVAVAMATFNLPADKAVDIVDNFVRAADASVAEVSGLVDALRNVGPTMAQFGWNIDDVNTALAILSERGIQGGEAGTALKSMLTNMMRQTEPVKDTWRELGISLYDAAGNMRDLDDIMADLEGAMAGMGEEQRNITIQTLAGTYGMKAMTTLLAEGSKGWGDMESAISTAADAQTVADAKMGGINGMLEQLSGSLETLGIKVGQVIIPFLNDLIGNYLIPFLDSIVELNPEILKWGVILAGVAAVVGPLLVVLGGLITAVSAISAPVLAVIVAVGALAAAFATNFGGIRDKLVAVWSVIQPVLMRVWEWLKVNIPAALAYLRDWFVSVWERIAPVVQEAIVGILGHLQKLQPIFEEVKAWVVATWPIVKEKIKEALDKAGEVIVWLAETIIPKLVDGFGKAVDWIVENWPKVKDAIKDVIDKVTEWWATHGDTIMTKAQEIWDKVQEIFDIFKEHWNTIFEAFRKAFEGDWYGFGETLRKAWDAAWERMKEIGENVWEAIKTFFAETDWGTIGNNLMQGIADGISAGAKLIKDAAMAAARAAWEAVKGFFGIESPSTLFADIGMNLDKGLAQGIEAYSQLPAVAMAGVAAGTVGAVNSGTQYYRYGDTYNVDDRSAWDAIQARRRYEQRVSLERGM